MRKLERILLTGILAGAISITAGLITKYKLAGDLVGGTCIGLGCGTALALNKNDLDEYNNSY